MKKILLLNQIIVQLWIKQVSFLLNQHYLAFITLLDKPLAGSPAIVNIQKVIPLYHS
jgi:hypothetical protein